MKCPFLYFNHPKNFEAQLASFCQIVWLQYLQSQNWRGANRFSDTWAKTPNDDDILAQNLLISDN